MTRLNRQLEQTVGVATTPPTGMPLALELVVVSRADRLEELDLVVLWEPAQQATEEIFTNVHGRLRDNATEMAGHPC